MSAKTDEIVRLIDEQVAELAATIQPLRDQIADVEKEMNRLMKTRSLVRGVSYQSPRPVRAGRQSHILPQGKGTSMKEKLDKIIQLIVERGPMSSREIGAVIGVKASYVPLLVAMRRDWFISTVVPGTTNRLGAKWKLSDIGKANLHIAIPNGTASAEWESGLQSPSDRPAEYVG